MRKLLNTVYVTTDGAWLKKDGDNLVMEVDSEEKARVPVHMLSGLVVFGRAAVSGPLLGFCAERGITVTYLSFYGRFLARVEGPVSGNVLLRRQQYRTSEENAGAVGIAQSFVVGKIANQRNVLRRAIRDHGEKMAPEVLEDLDRAQERLGRLAKSVLDSGSLDSLRGSEGEAAATYFEQFNALITTSDVWLRFNGRNRRPPTDPVNALLSLLYTLITHDCRSACETVGLDPAVGYLHRLRPGRPSLALDLAEEFRPILGDRLALSLINRGQLGSKDFVKLDNSAVILTEKGRKTLLEAYQERKREEMIHPFVGEKAPLGLFMVLQAQLLARHLRGDLDGYPPFIWK